MTNIVRLTVLSALLIILATTFSVPLAEAGSTPTLEIRMVETDKVEMKFMGEEVEMATLVKDDNVNICNDLDVPVQLTIQNPGLGIFNPPELTHAECVQLSVGDPQLPVGTEYKISVGSILIDGCSVGQGPTTVFSLGICPEVEVQVIGGKLIPIDATALLVAGVQTNYSILIALVVGGAAFVVFKLKRK